MNWKFWKKSVSPVQASTRNFEPFIHIGIHGDTKIQITTRWPRPESDEHATHIAHVFANLLYLINNGNILPLFQQSVSHAGAQTNNEGVSFQILDYLNESMGIGSKKKDRPMIHPLNAFGVNENDSGPSHMRQ